MGRLGGVYDNPHRATDRIDTTLLLPFVAEDDPVVLAQVAAYRAQQERARRRYLSDLAVDEAFQHQGIGKELIRRTHVASGEETTLILLAAPKAIDYYPKIGMVKYEHCFKIDRTR